jgi:hypothetical protein
VDECKLLPVVRLCEMKTPASNGAMLCDDAAAGNTSVVHVAAVDGGGLPSTSGLAAPAWCQGLTLAQFKAQLEGLRDTSLT